METKNLKKILDKVGKDSFLGMCITGFLSCEISQYYKMTVKELYDYKRRQEKYTLFIFPIFFGILTILGSILILSFYKRAVAIIYTIIFVSFMAYSIYRFIRLHPETIERLNKEEKQWNEYYQKKRIEEYNKSLYDKLHEIIDSKHEIIELGTMTDEELTNLYLKEKAKGDESKDYIPVIVQLDDNLMEDLPSFFDDVDFSNQPDATEYVQQAVNKMIKENTETWEEPYTWAEFTDPKNDDGYGATFDTLEQDQTGDNFALIKFHVDHPWEIFKYIAPVGGDEAPDPKDNIIYARHWYEKHNAVPAFLFYDTLYFYVPEPVAPQNCYQLALEQQAYCFECSNDSSIWGLVHSLEKSHFWNFWWD